MESGRSTARSPRSRESVSNRLLLDLSSGGVEACCASLLQTADDGLVVTRDRFMAGSKQGPRTRASTTDDRAVVLVVEDDPDLGPLLVDWLAEDHVVRLAESCAKALELVDEETDVALLDRTLPDGTGTDLLDEIRTAGIDCRVAMLTAMPLAGDVTESDFDEYLVKPIFGDDLRRTVVELLDR